MGKHNSVIKSNKEVNSNEVNPLKVGDTLIEKESSYNPSVIKISKIHKCGKITASYVDSNFRDVHFNNSEDVFKQYILLDKPLLEYEKELAGDILDNFSKYDEDSNKSDSTELVLAGGKDLALSAEKSLLEITQKMAVMQSIMAKKMAELQSIKSKFEVQLQSVRRVIGIIELYLGVNEEIVQFKDGDPAPMDTPISFRQLVLHMDEEVGDHRNGGLDFNNVSKFEEWLLVPKNLDQVLPEKKGVVVIRPRRRDKDYGSDDPFFNAQKIAENRQTFILIRNGDKLFHIFTTSINIYPHLFPSEKEMAKLYNASVGQSDNVWLGEEKAKGLLLGYQRNVLMLQGLMDRTEVFSPIPNGLNLMKPETYGEMVNFIYDADGLTDGKQSYDKWLKELNGQLQVGDRIYLASAPRAFNYEYGNGRQNFGRFPMPGRTQEPSAGIYNLLQKEVTSDSSWMGDAFRCKHLPSDRVWSRNSYQDSKRRSSTPFIVYTLDDFIINYEKIQIEDIDYYLNDRINRHNYLKMMPVLKGIKEMLLKERAMENEFIKLIHSNIPDKTEDDIKEAIEWWKRKVIEKRPLTKEDAKAVRMILQKLKK